ncbi:MAG: ATP phosphoribosyltransferase regulatory subunit [Acidovorax sp. SCN 65-108]|nr:MAG: ATP phosphoribosyltransferase regulatory subunit [Acidovorax sp. SCN 65-108]OJV70899.1 MAG: ATP phosphoribosyltransferase regulatory subunit [Burkholderiales bacterium 64-34]
MSAPSVHDDWLSLIEISGPFLAVPVLKEAFPQGLEELDATKRKRLRQAYEEWREALELEDAQFAELHVAWIDEVLSRGLELDEDGKGDVLKRADWCIANLQANLPEHGVTLSPALAVVDEQRANKPLLLIQTYAQDVDLDTSLKQDGWAATPADRMVQLCRSLGCRLGLVTNGERWMLVDAPVGAVTTFASWYARIWSQEPITLQALVHLLGIRRFFVDESEQLPSLFDRSLKFQDEVTEALGEQVRRAVEVLIQTLDKADQDRNRELLHDVKEPELYEAALTVMMRLVFLLSAEERSLLLMGDERYEANYALSTLRMQLRKESEEILERRWDAWSRLLAIFRAVFGGIEHENLRLPALGGSLFDPDRFPFLEGRAKDSNWRSDAAKPLPIDNRTVLLLLEAIQQFQGRTLSYRALDVEQIGYVYEGLLERTVKRTAEVTLELDATKTAQSPWVTLAELESAWLDGAEQLAELLQQRSGSSASRVRNDLARPVDDALADRVLTACHGNTALRDRIKPFGHLVRTDPWGYPLVYPAGAFVVTTGSDRRETGTHYTPKSLTEAIVAETLTPIAYVGPAQGMPRAEWALKSPAELLDLKICDPAMGSGAFLVQACRWLADRLVEAWAQAEARDRAVSSDGRIAEADANVELLPRDTEARTIIARRFIAERCLYGVDLNPLAVELAKLSIWLVTLAKGRPFGFLDHNLRCGDSLLGIHRLDQLTQLSMNPTGQGQLRLFGQNIERAVLEAITLRQRLREMPIRDIRDVKAMAHLDADARRRLEMPGSIADAFIGEVLVSGGSGAGLENALASLTVQAGQVIDGDRDVLASMRRRSIDARSTDLPGDKPTRQPFHWPLEFPEVMDCSRRGFDALIGNPPFMGGKKITSVFGEAYRECLVKGVANDQRGNADLSAYFFLRAASLLKNGGALGMLATSTLSQGETRRICLGFLSMQDYSIYRAIKSFDWPGKANLSVSMVWIFNGTWCGHFHLDGNEVAGVTPALAPQGRITGEPKRLIANIGLAFQGSNARGMGFVLSHTEAAALIRADSRNSEVIFPFLGGDDILSNPDQLPSRWIINFFDWSQEKASSYSMPFKIVQERVLPERLKIKDEVKRRTLSRDFWKYDSQAKALYKKIGTMTKYMVHPLTSKHHVFGMYAPGITIGHTAAIVALNNWDDLALLQSGIHWAWALEYGNKLANRPQYLPTTCFDTFAFPSVLCAEMAGLGESFYAKRKELTSSRAIGTTTAHNMIDSASETSSDVVELRTLMEKIDKAVLASYGWDDIDLSHGFHLGAQGIRFTFSEKARIEILQRLLALNHQRYKEEVAKGLHADATPYSSTRSPRAGRVSGAATAQPSFDFEAMAATAVDGSPATAILGFLSARDGWHGKADVLAATAIADGQWNAAIADLISSGRVERQGEKRGARYRIQSDHRGDDHEGTS